MSHRELSLKDGPGLGEARGHDTWEWHRSSARDMSAQRRYRSVENDAQHKPAIEHGVYVWGDRAAKSVDLLLEIERPEECRYVDEEGLSGEVLSNAHPIRIVRRCEGRA